MSEALRQHWETMYTLKKPADISWTEDMPAWSLKLIHDLHLPKTAHIADIGGGDSKLADYLLTEGFANITVVDISAAALKRARRRLGKKRAAMIHWVVSDITEYTPAGPIDLWHDRAAFHFLTHPTQVIKYLYILNTYVTGHVIMAAFSTDGPDHCSGLPVQQYSEGSMCRMLGNDFDKLLCKTVIHTTPTNARQEFLYCGFKKHGWVPLEPRHA